MGALELVDRLRRYHAVQTDQPEHQRRDAQYAGAHLTVGNDDARLDDVAFAHLALDARKDELHEHPRLGDGEARPSNVDLLLSENWQDVLRQLIVVETSIPRTEKRSSAAVQRADHAVLGFSVEQLVDVALEQVGVVIEHPPVELPWDGEPRRKLPMSMLGELETLRRRHRRR